jgi:hypothetical protein
MEAFPHIDTIRYYCTDPTQLYPQSHMLDFHNKADGHERRIATYLVENFRTKTELEVRTALMFLDILGSRLKWHPIRTGANAAKYSHSSTSRNYRKQRPSCSDTGGGDVSGARIATVEVRSSGSSMIAGR